MKTLANGNDFQSIAERLKAVRSDDAARWGRMNAHQMLRHVGDAIKVPLQEIQVSQADVPQVQRELLKWAALYFPFRWRRNFATRPEIDQCMLNVPLGDFETDREAAIVLLGRLCNAGLEANRHPYFGTITRTEWLRWGWLHTDHHLRQFGR